MYIIKVSRFQFFKRKLNREKISEKYGVPIQQGQKKPLHKQIFHRIHHNRLIFNFNRFDTEMIKGFTV